MISPEAPYPMDGGGALRTASLLHYLARNYLVDLVVFQHPGQRTLKQLPAGIVARFVPIPLTPHRGDVLSKGRRNAVRLVRLRPPLLDRFSGYHLPLAQALKGYRYETAVLEHFWSATYLELAKRQSNLVVLDLHNVDSAWHAACSRVPHWPRSLAHRVFAHAALREERRLFPHCDLALAASAADAERVREIHPATRVSVYPNALPWRDEPPGDGDFAIAFSGNLEYEPNRTGLEFFLKRIWPLVRSRHPRLEFRILGRNPGAIPADLRALPGTHYSGAVEDTFSLLGSARICVAPLLSGSGTRLKIIEAWAAGRPVVSTSIGAEGLGAIHDESILIADTPEDFAAAIGRLLMSEHLRQMIAKRGREQYERNFTWIQAWKSLDGLF